MAVLTRPFQNIIVFRLLDERSRANIQTSIGLYVGSGVEVAGEKL